MFPLASQFEKVLLTPEIIDRHVQRLERLMRPEEIGPGRISLAYVCPGGFCARVSCGRHGLWRPHGAFLECVQHPGA